MKHTKYLVPLLALCLLLAACGSKPGENPPEASSLPAASSRPGSASLPTPDVSEPDASAPDSSQPDASAPETPAPLTEANKAAAYDAACDYYLGTVFEVHKLVEISTRQGEITFQVECSKGGVRADPDRTISLERKNGGWTVVSEGY